MILIVDDQKYVGTGLERLLRYAGHESVSVTGGAEAIAMLHVRKPSLVVLDVNMPEMDGLTVLRTIKEHDELEDVRIVMYSADTHHETMAEAKRLGAVDFLVKGTIGFEKLVARPGKNPSFLRSEMHNRLAEWPSAITRLLYVKPRM